MPATLDDLVQTMQSIRIDTRDEFEKTRSEMKNIAEKLNHTSKSGSDHRPSYDDDFRDVQDRIRERKTNPQRQSNSIADVLNNIPKPPSPIPTPKSPTPRDEESSRHKPMRNDDDTDYHFPPWPTPKSPPTPRDDGPSRLFPDDDIHMPPMDLATKTIDLSDILKELVSIHATLKNDLGGKSSSKDAGKDAGKNGKTGDDDSGKKKKLPDVKKAFLDGLEGGLLKIAAPILIAEKAITNFGDKIAAFVGKANPAAVIRFNLAMDDFTAVIGQALTPVLNRVTMLVRMMADAFVSLSGPAKQLIAAMVVATAVGTVLAAIVVAIGAAITLVAPEILILGAVIGALGAALAGLVFVMAKDEDVAEGFRAILATLSEALELFAQAIQPMIPALMFVIKCIADLLFGLAYLASFLSKVYQVVERFLLLGQIVWPADREKKSSINAAVRESTIESSTSYANRAYTMAFGAGNSALDVARSSDSTLKGIKDLLQGFIGRRVAPFIANRAIEVRDTIRRMREMFT